MDWREFQHRVLVAVEKPKRNRLLSIINSPFFLWLMSVLVLSIGGSYITNHKQCLDDADKSIERRNHLSQELLVRENAIAVRAKEAKTLQDASRELTTLFLSAPPAPDPDKPSSIFTDLSKVSYIGLQNEFKTLTGRIKYAELPDPSIAEYRKSMKTPRDEKMYHDPQTLSEDGKKQSSPDEGQSLKLLQSSLSLLVAQQTFEKVLDAVAYHFRPYCSVINVAALAFGYRTPIVFAEISPLYDTGDVRRFIKVTIQDIEQKQKDFDTEFKKVNPRP